MKVLFVSNGITPYFSALLKKISSKGVEICVLTAKDDNPLAVRQGVKLIAGEEGYKIVKSEEKQAWYKKPKLVSLHNVLVSEKPDILAISWPYFLQLYFDRKILKSLFKKGGKLMIYEIPFQTPPYRKIFSYFKKNPMYNEDMELQSKGLSFYIRAYLITLIRKWCYKRVTGTLNYTTNAYNIIGSYGVNPDSIFVTYNATDNEYMDKLLEEVNKFPKILCPNKYRILHIGRLVKWKKVDLLIDSFVDIVKEFPQSELVIIGNGPELSNLKQKVSDLGIAESVIFTGAVHDQQKLVQYMTESTVYVLAGMGGLSINDAMTCKLPIICSVCDGTEKELVIDGENGFFFKDNDRVDLTNKIKIILSDSEKAEKMGQKSKEIIDTKINIDTVSERYVKAFEYVAQQK